MLKREENPFIKKLIKYLIMRESDDIENKIIEFEKITAGDKLINVSDEVSDFLDLLFRNPTRWKSFANYIKDNYQLKKYNNILDVGCGKFADLSIELIKEGYNVTCIDPNLNTDKINVAELKLIKDIFDYRIFDVAKYDLIIGLEPCDATEHIVRSALNNNKEFVVSLCATPHKSIDGKSFLNKNEWYQYLLNLYSDALSLEHVEIMEKKHCIIKRKY